MQCVGYNSGEFLKGAKGEVMSRVHDNPAVNGRTHDFHAEATVVSGTLHQPFPQTIEPQAKSNLFHKGGYLAQHVGEFRVEGVLTFQKAYTQVAGNPGKKEGHGWSTLTTTVVEKLNVLEILTADKVVGQIITEHPLKGYVPRISFLGTRFEGLKIAGFPVEIEWDLNILGDKPEKDHGYSQHEGVLKRVKDMVKGFGKPEQLPAEVTAQYNRLSSNVESPGAVECSLVKKAWGGYPGFTFGHIIRVPDFGTIELAKLSVVHEDYGKSGYRHNPDPKVPETTTITLTMIDLKLGCAVDGDIPVGTSTNNGGTKPGGNG
jgi:hypothetical protein